MGEESNKITIVKTNIHRLEEWMITKVNEFMQIIIAIGLHETNLYIGRQQTSGKYLKVWQWYRKVVLAISKIWIKFPHNDNPFQIGIVTVEQSKIVRKFFLSRYHEVEDSGFFSNLVYNDKTWSMKKYFLLNRQS